MVTTAIPVPRQAAAATNQMIQTRTLPITRRRARSAGAGPARARSLRPTAPRSRCGCFPRSASAARLERRLGRVVGVGIGDGHALDRLREEHVLRVDEVVARVFGDLELVAERDRVERARELAVAAEDAAAHVDLVDTRVALAGGHPGLGGALLRPH